MRVELAELPAVDQFHGLLEIGDAAALGAGLEDPLRAVDGVGQLLAGGDGDAARLLAIDVLAGFGGQDRGRRVPAVAGGDQHGVDVLAVEQFAEVAVKLAVLVAVVLVHQRLAGLAPLGLHVGNRHAADIRERQHRLQVVGAARTDADDSRA